jgi:hypothetical protein
MPIAGVTHYRQSRSVPVVFRIKKNDGLFAATGVTEVASKGLFSADWRQPNN